MGTDCTGTSPIISIMNQFAIAVQLASAGEKKFFSKKAPLSIGDEEDLYNRFLAGEDRACLELFQRYNQRLYLYCVKMVGDLEQAEDLTQEAWGRLVELRAEGRPLHNPIGFLMRIVRNLCLDHLKSRRRLLSLEMVHESSLPSYFIHEPSEMEELVVTALQKLSFDYREVLVLNVYCGYSFEEIAKILGKTPESIWTRASRARAQLRKLVCAARDGKPGNTASKSKAGGRGK